MKKWTMALTGAIAVIAGAFVFQAGVAAQGNGAEKMQNGIFVGDIDVSGMGKEEAESAVRGYVDGLRELPVTLNAVGGNQITVTVGDMGIQWENPQVLDDAFSLGKEGNIIKRYKELRELERNTKRYDMELSFDRAALTTL